MKAIIFNAVDNFGKEYSFVVVCDETDVNAAIDKNRNLCTEIVSYNVVNAFNYKK